MRGRFGFVYLSCLVGLFLLSSMAVVVLVAKLYGFKTVMVTVAVLGCLGVMVGALAGAVFATFGSRGSLELDLEQAVAPSQAPSTASDSDRRYTAASGPSPYAREGSPTAGLPEDKAVAAGAAAPRAPAGSSSPMLRASAPVPACPPLPISRTVPIRPAPTVRTAVSRAERTGATAASPSSGLAATLKGFLATGHGQAAASLVRQKVGEALQARNLGGLLEELPLLMSAVTAGEGRAGLSGLAQAMKAVVLASNEPDRENLARLLDRVQEIADRSKTDTLPEELRQVAVALSREHDPQTVKRLIATLTNRA